MRNIFYIILITIFMAGCGTSEAPALDDTKIYYISLDETTIEYEEHELSGKSPKEKVDEVLAFMKSSPSDRKLKPVLSEQIEPTEVRVSDGLTTLVFGDEYRLLSPTTEVLIRAALVRSLCQIDEISYVAMQIRDEPLNDALGNPVGIMEASSFLDNTGSEINTYEKASIKLYFTDIKGNKLKVVTRNLTYNTNISLERLVVEQLIKGPYTDDLFPTVNPFTRVLGVTVRDNICYVNLDEAFLTPNVNATPEATIFSITNSLAELSNVNKVQISVNGENERMFREKLSLGTVYERNLEIME